MSAFENMNFATDSRTQGPAKPPALFVTGENGDEIEIELPSMFEVCPVCSGSGSHVNPSIDSSGLSSLVLNDDPDFAEAYIRGDYDVTCNRCEGRRVVPVVDWDAVERDKSLAEFGDIRAAWNEQLREEAVDRDCYLAELRAGA